jgi:antitoxin CptB
MSISARGYRQGHTTVTSSSVIRRKRLLFRSWHRGTRESDLILGRFADAYLAGFEEAQLDRYEVLLDCPDVDIFDWVSGRAAPPPEHDHDVTRLLLTFSNAYPHPPSPDELGPPSPAMRESAFISRSVPPLSRTARTAGEGAERSEAGEGTPEE